MRFEKDLISVDTASNMFMRRLRKDQEKTYERNIKSKINITAMNCDGRSVLSET